MALPTKTITYDNLSSSTTSEYSKFVTDNIFNQSITWQELQKNAKPYTGGEDIIVPVMYAKGNGGSFEGFDVMTPADKQIVTNARYHIANYWADVVIAKTDMEKNRGAAQVFDLLETKFENARLTMIDQLNVALNSTGTATPNLIGLSTHIYASATGNTVGGIDGSVETWWANQYYDGTSLATLTMGKLQSEWGECSDGAESPTMLTTTQAVYDKIWTLADAKQRLGVEAYVKLGFTNIEFNGKPIVVDKGATSGIIRYINSKYLFLKNSDITNLSWGPWKENTTQEVKVKRMFWTGQLVQNNRRRQGIMVNLT